MADVKTKRIRWIGKSEGVPRSVLNVAHPGGLKTYFPGALIDDVAHLAALGEERIAALIKEGKKLESFFNTELAAMLIYRESGYKINPARFYDSNEDALADMKKLAEL